MEMKPEQPFPTEPITSCSSCLTPVDHLELRMGFALISGVRYKTTEEWVLPCGHNIIVIDSDQWENHGALSVIKDLLGKPVLSFYTEPM
jgi:hypothetical protein